MCNGHFGPGIIVLVLLTGCGGSTNPRSPLAIDGAPEWITQLLTGTVGSDGAAVARARLFESVDDREVFVGLLAFARAEDVDLRKIAAFHLSSMAAVIETFGLPVRDTLAALADDEDPDVRRLADRRREPPDGEMEKSGIDSGVASVGEEFPIPYPYLGDVHVHLRVNSIDEGSGTSTAKIDYRAEARVSDGSVLAATGSQYGPDFTGCRLMGIGADDGQYGFDLWLRVLEGNSVRWWLRALKRPASPSEGD